MPQKQGTYQCLPYRMAKLKVLSTRLWYLISAQEMLQLKMITRVLVDSFWHSL